MIFDNIGLDALPAVSDKIVELSASNKVFCFYGDLGSGKTTLIKLICEALKVEDSVSSPTYPIINEYQYPEGLLYHIDLYRLKNKEEALNIGLEDYLFSGNLCFIEWPDHFESLLPTHIKIFIRKLDENHRQIELVR